MTWTGVKEWRSLVLRAGLPVGAEHTALCLAHYSSPENGLVCVPERQLARDARYSRTAISNHLRVLEQRGLIRRSAAAGRGRTSVYVLQFPEHN